MRDSAVYKTENLVEEEDMVVKCCRVRKRRYKKRILLFDSSCLWEWCWGI